MTDRDFLMLKYLSEYQNITKTAAALYISQPALTARIKQLEQELSTKLIQSSNKGVQLTAAGQAAAACAVEMLQLLDGLKEQLRIIDNDDAVTIRIAAPVIISKNYLPSLIKAYQAEHPQTRFEIVAAHSSQVVSMMKENRCHVGFIRNDFGWDEDKRILLGMNYIAAVSMQPFELSDLVHMQRVAYETDTYYQKMLAGWWKETFASEPQVAVRVDSLDLCRKMVFSGLGFGLLPSIFLDEQPNAYSYILKDKQGKPIERRTWLIYHGNATANKTVRSFIEFVRAHEFSSFLHLIKEEH